MKIAPGLIDAHAELKKICEFFTVIAEDSGVNIRCTGDAKVFADPLLFQRAVANLLSNALRYTPRGGVIMLEVKSEPAGPATVTVSNPGAGIPAEHLARLFDRLYRIESSREKTTEGAGLGLAIVKSIMGLHRGSVSVESKPGGPTIFSLRFPASPATRA
jgi:two-component system heavy metal sensor histidine kinase CusS